jgi:hypothetical protein
MRIGGLGNSKIRHKDWLAERDRDDLEKYSIFPANPSRESTPSLDIH